MAKSVYEIVIDAQYKGRGVKAAEKDMKGVSLATEVTAQKTAKLEAEWKDLARQVASGSKSFSAAEKEADELTRQMGELDRATDKVSVGTEKTSKSFGSFASQAAIAGGVIVGVGVAAKQAYEFIGEGAQLSFAAGKFDNLSVSINTTGDALLGKMKIATKGMISDANLIASGTDIMSLGLAKTEDGVVRMASAVGALDLDMQVLALTLANDSTMRLDNLGLSLEAVTARKKELIASGFIGDAFDEAVLIELEQKMLLLGDASETTAGKMKILEANVANVKDSAAILVAESGLVNETISRWSNLATGLTSVLAAKRDAQDDLNAAVSAGIITDEEAIVIYHKAKEGLEGGSEALEDVRYQMSRLTEETASADSVMLSNINTVEMQAAAASDLNEEERQLTLTRIAAVDVSNNYADSLYDNASAATEVSAKLMEAAFAETALMEAQLAAVGVTNSSISILDGYSTALGQSDTAMQTAAGRQDEYRQSLDDMNNNVDIAADRVDNLAMKLLGIPPSVTSTVTVDTSAAEAAIGSLERKLFGISGAAGAGANQSTSASPSEPSFGGGATGGIGMASGGQFTVPSGFQNDSYPIMVETGERVTVETPSQQAAGTFSTGGDSGGNTFNFYGMDIGDVRNLLKEEGVSADSRRRMA